MSKTQESQIDMTFQTEVLIEESPVKKKIKLLDRSAALNQSNDTFYRCQSSLLHPAVLAPNHTSSLEKFMRARDLAEQKAKEKIDRLNLLIAKWQAKDEKAKELINESIMDKKFRLGL